MFKFCISSLRAAIMQKLQVACVSGPKIELSLTVGFYLCLFPVAGVSTILCFVFGFIFRLNHGVLQAINFLLWPFQIALIFPMLKAGRMLFYSDKSIRPNVSFFQLLRAENLSDIYYFLNSVIGGIAVWGCISVVTFPFLYLLFQRLTK